MKQLLFKTPSSLVKLHIFQIKKSLTHDQKKHDGSEHLYSLVKLHYFQFAFLENCVYKKQKKSIKDQRNFCSDAFFKVFANFVCECSF